MSPPLLPERSWLPLLLAWTGAAPDPAGRDRDALRWLDQRAPASP